MRSYNPGDIWDDQFKILATVGSGAFGTVLKVENLFDGREYAMKVFQARMRSNVQRELQAMQAVNHPNINRVVWSGTLSSGEYYLLSEMVEGTTLRDYATPHLPLPPEEVVRLGLQLLSALVALHPDEERLAELRSLPELSEIQASELFALKESGWIHRDLNPENVMVRSSGDIVLIDFGIAVQMGTPVRTQSHTPGYSPPDADFTQWSPDVDLFASGAVMFELACGVLPYDEGSSQLLDPASLVDHMPLILASFLRRACAPRRPQRFDTARAMYSALQKVARTLVPSGSAGAPAGTSMPSQRELAKGALPYASWSSRPLKGAGGSSPDELVDALVEIAAIEGPVVCERLYELYVGASGDPGVASVKRQLNQAAYRAVTEGRLHQVEALGGGQIDKTLYMPGTDSVVVRTRGPRAVRHIPRSEVAALGTLVEQASKLERDAVLDEVATFYGVSPENWHDRQYLSTCLDVV